MALIRNYNKDYGGYIEEHSLRNDEIIYQDLASKIIDRFKLKNCNKFITQNYVT